jgi:transposase-like protein
MVHAMNANTTQAPVAVTEGGRRPTGVTATGGPTSVQHLGLAAAPTQSPSASGPNPEVIQKAERRRFSLAYKLDILKQADACSGHGEIGALLRREGLYSSTLANWRLLRSQGRLGSPPAKKRGPVSTTDKSADTARVRQLERENASLTARLQQAELVLDIQKKVSEMLAIPLKHLTSEGSDS